MATCLAYLAYLRFCLLMNSIASTSMINDISTAATIPIINPIFEEPVVGFVEGGGEFAKHIVKIL